MDKLLLPPPLINRVQNLDVLDYLRLVPSDSIHCCVTSPPYFGLRDYGVEGQIGVEETPARYVEKLVRVFREVRRVLRPDGTCWLNLGDSYVGATSEYSEGGSAGKNSIASKKTLAGLPTSNRKARTLALYEMGLPIKSLMMIPARVALALQESGWILRSEIVWSKPNPIPESVTDRPTKAHEMIYLLTKSPLYWYDAAAIKEPSIRAGEVVPMGDKSFGKGQALGAGIPPHGNGLNDTYTVKDDRNKRSVWTVATQPVSYAHFACFPEKLIEPMILAGCPEGGIVLDPFMGSGTTAAVAERLGRRWQGCELNPEYIDIIKRRLVERGGALEHLPMFSQETVK